MKTSIRKLCTAAVVGAAYAALTVLLAYVSYSPVQFRVAEALCVLPFFMPCTTWGLLAGCAMANLIGGAGFLDFVFGSLATLLAALCVSALGRGYRRSGTVPGAGRLLAVCVMPAAFNGPIVGAVLAYAAMGANMLSGFLLICAQVAAGELIVLLALGYPLMRLILARAALRELCARLGT